MLQDIAAILETCLEQITAGGATVQECLDQYPDLVGELEPLLRAAERAQTIDRPSLAPEVKARIEARFLAAAESIPSGWPYSVLASASWVSGCSRRPAVLYLTHRSILSSGRWKRSGRGWHRPNLLLPHWP